MVVAALAMVSAAQAQNERGIAIGPQAGAYFPTDGTTRDLLGVTWWNIGLGPTRAEVAEGWKFSSDMKFLSRRNKGNKVFIVMPSFGFTKSFGYIEDKWVPYFAARTGPAYMDYSFTRSGRYVSTKRVGWNTNIEGGLVIDGKLRISAGYTWLPKYDGLDFSGFSIGATFELFRW